MNPNFADIELDSNFFADNFASSSHGISSDAYYDTAKFNSKFNNMSLNDLSIIHVNIRSLPRNGITLLAYLRTLNHKFSLICFTETWLNSDRFMEDIFPEYIQYYSMRSSQRAYGGGAAILIHKSIQSQHISELSSNDEHIECVFASIKYCGTDVIVGSCYRRPDPSSAQTFISTLSNKISRTDPRTIKIIAGDFNYNLLNIETDQNCSSFFDSMLSMGLLHSISKPSRVFGNAMSLLDNIFVSNTLAYESGLLQWDITDHYPVFAILKDLFTNRNHTETIRFRLINEVSLDNFYESLRRCNFDNVLNDVNLDTAFDNLDTILLDHLNQFCPIITKRINSKDREKPWVNSYIKRLFVIRQNKFRTYREGTTSFDEYKGFRNFVNRQNTLARQNYFTNLLNNVKNNMKKTWSILNKIVKPNSDRSKPFIRKILLDDQIFEEDIDISNVFNKHFSSIGSNISASFPDVEHSISSNTSISNSFFFTAVSPEDVCRIINGLKNKSCGIDSYPAKVLKHIKNIISPILSNLFTKCLLSSHFPTKFKIARVIPLHKGNDKDNVNNYRPISLLPLLSKILERAVYNQVYNFLETHNLLSITQYGFRKNRSTVMAVLDHLEYVYKNLDEGNTVVSIFMDFSKAFDCLDHRLLLKKLRHYGIRGMALDWFVSYLSDRRQFVAVNLAESSLLSIAHGVPQGSILGPLLFLLFINDFPNVNSFFKFILFADDSTLSCHFNHSNELIIRNKLETELQVIYNWLAMNKIKINFDKSNFIFFSYGKEYNLETLKFGPGMIYVTDRTKFLGIVIDRNLKFKFHVSTISTKLAKVNGILFRLNNVLPFDCLKTLYSSLFAPHILYGMEIWFGILLTNDERIFKLQKKAIRAVNLLPYNHHTNDYFKQMEILKVHDLYKLRTLLYTFSNNFFTQADVHDHNTRNRNNLVVPQYRRARTQSSIFYQGISLWNNLPSEVREIQSLNSFKSHVKSTLISYY